jgi:hypothetical protein
MLAYAGLVLVDFVTRSAADRACPYPGQAVKKATSLLCIGEASDPVRHQARFVTKFAAPQAKRNNKKNLILSCFQLHLIRRGGRSLS